VVTYCFFGLDCGVDGRVLEAKTWGGTEVGWSKLYEAFGGYGWSKLWDAFGGVGYGYLACGKQMEKPVIWRCVWLVCSNIWNVRVSETVCRYGES
jgi:hypothetical protein